MVFCSVATAILHTPCGCHRRGGACGFLKCSDTPWNLSGNRLSSIGLSGQGKSTSLEARRLLEADQRIGQAEKGQMAPGELVPPNDEPPIAIQPGVQPFHHPAPRTLAQLPRGRL